MKVVVAPDSFKGSLTAVEASGAIARGVRKAAPSVEVVEMPLADGGEGTVEALVAARGGRFVEVDARDPLGRPIRSRYGLLDDGETAVIEMAAASGLPLLAENERNPLETSTFGTGQLILDAARRGARKILVGIGGSATVDGGTGMARALGVMFLDSDGRELAGGGEILQQVATIDASKRPAELDGVSVTVACDVTNPLTGPEGAARVYGPQKGATGQMVEALEAGLANLARVIKQVLGVDVQDLPGTGAAGGLGAGLVAFLGARLEGGVQIVLEAARAAEKIAGADAIFTGEGRVDRQSAYGKVVAGIGSLAAAEKVPLVILAGSVADGADEMRRHGATAILAIATGAMTEDEMKRDAAALLENAAEQCMRLFVSGRSACDRAAE
ncbi:MAG: glycerate kinase [Planctomycetota bacterium]|jgi:glycerate kinase